MAGVAKPVEKDAERWMAEHPFGLAAAMGLSTGFLVLIGGGGFQGAGLGVAAMAPFGACASVIVKRGRRPRERKDHDDTSR